MTKKVFFPAVLLACILSMMSYTGKQDNKKSPEAQPETGKPLIISTSSAEEVEKVKQSLADVDPSTYRITVNKLDASGKVVTETFGSAPLSEVEKIRTDFKVPSGTPGQGGLAASDIIILVKNITKGSIVQDKILQQLDKKLSRVVEGDITFSGSEANFKHLKTDQVSETGKILILSTTNATELEKVKKRLESLDASTYRLTINQAGRNGKITSTTLGTAPISEVEKVRTDLNLAVTTPGKGQLAASDIIILVKNIIKGSIVQDKILQDLDSRFSKVVQVDIRFTPNAAGFQYLGRN